MSAVVDAGVIQAILRLKDELTPALGRVTSGLTQSGNTMRSVGTSILPISAAMSAVGIAGIKMATDLNASMANVASLIPGSTARVIELKQAVQDMSIATGKSTDDLAGGLYEVISAFGNTAESAKILEINARAAVAGVASTSEAIALTGAVTKGYGDTTAAAVEKVSDLALLTVRLGKTNFPELASSIGRVTPLAAALKVTQEELFGAMATFTGVTGGAAEVSTQLRGVLQSLMAPTDEMSALMAKLGVSSGETMIQQFGLQGTINKVVEAAKASGQPLQEYLSSIEGQTLALAATGGQAADFTSKLAQMKTAAGTTTQAFDEQTKGVNAAGFQFTQLKNELTVMAQNLGDALIPRLMEGAQALKPFWEMAKEAVSWFSALPEPVKTAAAAAALIVAISAPTLMAIGVGFNAVAAGIAATGTASEKAIPFVKGFWTALTGPAGILLGIGAGIVYIGDKMREVAGISDDSAKRLSGGWASAIPILGPLRGMWSEISGSARSAGTEVTTQVTAMTGALINQNTRGLIPTIDLTGKANALLAEQARVLGPPRVGTQQLTEAQQKYREEVQALIGQLGGNNLNAQIQKLTDAWRAMTPEQRKFAIETGVLVKELISASAAGGTFRGELAAILKSQQLLTTQLPVMTNAFANLRDIWRDMPSVQLKFPTPQFQVPISNDPYGIIGEIERSLIRAGAETRIKLPAGPIAAAIKSQFSEALAGLGGVIVGAIQGGGDVGRAAGASLGSAVGSDLATNILGKSTSTLLKGALSMLGPFGALLGGKVGELVGKIFGNAGRDAAIQFAQGMGGFDSLRQQLLVLGEEGERLWVQLTQVARGEREVAAASAAITAALARQREQAQALRDEMSRLAEGTGLASAALIAFRDANPLDENVQSFVLGQVQAAGSAAGSMLEAIQRSSTAAARANIEAQIALTRAAIAEASGSLRDELQAQLEDLQAQSQNVRGQLVLTAGGASAMAGILLAAWDGTAQGLRDMAPDIARLQQALADSGLTGSQSFSDLAAMAGLASSEVAGPLLEAINYGTQALTGMYNAGFLTQETFSGMVGEIMAQRDALLATGATSSTVNGAMRGDLQRIWELVQDGNYALDDRTRALLEQAEASGEVGNQFRSTEDRILQVLERIADMFETTFGSGLTESARRGAQAAADALRAIPTEIDVTVRTSTRVGGGGQGGGGGTDDNPPGYASGTMGRYVDFGAGTNVVLHGRERVMTETEGRFGSGDTHLHFDMRGAVIREEADIDKLADAVFKNLIVERGL